MPRGKTAKSLALIDAMRAILDAIQPASTRAVCYQLFITGRIPSMEKTRTNRVSSQLTYARMEGIIPWEWVVDETRDAERPSVYQDPGRFIPVVMASYRRDRWALQTHRLEVWSEKGTIRGTLAPLLRTYGLTFRVMHGFTSATYVHDVCAESREDPRPMTALYLGDYDPSGLYMSERDLPERIMAMGGRLHVERLALHGDDARARQLPSFPASTKTTDTRYAWFVQHYGATCWEIDALNPVDLRAMVEQAITRYIDWPAWQRCDVVEQAERHSLETILGTWHKAISGLATI